MATAATLRTTATGAGSRSVPAPGSAAVATLRPACMTTVIGTQRPEPEYTSTTRTRAATVPRHCHPIHPASRPTCRYGTRCQAPQTAPRTRPVPVVPRQRRHPVGQVGGPADLLGQRRDQVDDGEERHGGQWHRCRRECHRPVVEERREQHECGEQDDGGDPAGVPGSCDVDGPAPQRRHLCTLALDRRQHRRDGHGADEHQRARRQQQPQPVQPDRPQQQPERQRRRDQHGDERRQPCLRRPHPPERRGGRGARVHRSPRRVDLGPGAGYSMSGRRVRRRDRCARDGGLTSAV